MVDKITKEYLVKLMECCQEYDVFDTYLGQFEDFRKVRLQDVYMAPYILELEDAKIMSSFHTEESIRKQISSMLSTVGRQELQNLEWAQCEMNGESNGLFGTLQDNKEIVRYKKIVYASEGGGKTSFSNMYALLCAYVVLGEEVAEDRVLDRFLLSHNVLSTVFQIDRAAVPILVHALEFFLAMENGEDKFEEVLIEKIMMVLKDTERIRAEHVYKTNAITLVIDEIDTLPGGCLEKVMKELREYLDINQEKVHVMVLTASNPINCVLDEFMEKIDVERYVLPELQNGSVDWMLDFAKRWYGVLSTVSERNMDVEKDFLLPLTRNAEVLSRISTPKELTDILTISLYDSCLPSDVVSMTKRLFELKLKEAELDEDELVLGLAGAAYEMMESGKDYILERNLKRYIAGDNEELQAYAFDLCFDDEEAMDRAIDSFEEELHVNEKIDCLKKWKIIEEKYAGQYETIHTNKEMQSNYNTNQVRYGLVNRDEKAYLAAYAIKHNLANESGKKERFDYIKNKIVEKDESWKDTIVNLAVIDDKLQGKIIQELLELAENTEDDSYYAALLLELSINSEIDFLFEELKKLFAILVKKCNWGLFLSERSKIERMMLKNSTRENTLWAEILVKRFYSSNSCERELYWICAKSAFLFCAQQCEIKEEMVGKMLKSHRKPWWKKNN